MTIAAVTTSTVIALVIISARRGGDGNRLSSCLQCGESRRGQAGGDGDGVRCGDI